MNFLCEKEFLLMVGAIMSLSIKKKSILLFLIFFSFFSFGKDDGSVVLYASYYDCAKWNDEPDNPLSVKNFSSVFWLAGYMSAMNQMANKNLFDNVGATVAGEYIKDYCKRHPEEDVANGIIEMIAKIHGK
jgi:hypothetical protein